MIAQEIADTILYKENQRRSALAAILDSLRITHEQGKIRDLEYLYAVEWVQKHASE